MQRRGERVPFTRDRNAFGKRARSDGRAPQERVRPPERLGFGHCEPRWGDEPPWARRIGQEPADRAGGVLNRPETEISVKFAI